MRTFTAISVGKFIDKISKTFNLGGGSAAPGLYALKIDSKLIEKLSRKVPRNIIITGTNGKTTTSRMLAHFAKASGLKVIRNHTGSNLERGVASTLIHHWALLNNKFNFDLGIWEVDEAAFNTIVSKVNPDAIIFLNAFRDQLDRYGEVDSVVRKWRESLKKVSKSTKVIINADDTNTQKLINYFDGQIQTFGVSGEKIAGERSKEPIKRISPDYAAQKITFDNLSSTKFELIAKNLKFDITLPIPGLYHIYDFLGAFALGKILGFSEKIMISSLTSFSPAFGRVEKLTLENNKEGYIFLIKNPVGTTQVLKTIIPSLKPDDRMLLALNDNFADGKDVSWIWDAEFEILHSINNKLQIICSGTREFDLAIRLKYAGVEQRQVSTEPSLQKALVEAQSGLKGRLFILPTYTAMLKLQGILTELGFKKTYWKESD